MAILQLTEKDVNILQDLANCRLLTLKQIKRLYYSNVKWGHYKRIEKMRQNGLVVTRPLMGKRGKEGVCVYLTKKGFKAINLPHLEPTIKHIPSHMQNFRVAISEIYTQLKDSSWEWTDSREIKAELPIYRGSVMAAVLTQPTGECYFLYMTTPSPKEESIGTLLKDISLNLGTQSHIRNVIIFCHNRNDIRQLEVPLEGASKMLLLQYPDDIGLLKKLTDPDVIVNHPDLEMDDRFFTRDHQPFANMRIELKLPRGTMEAYLTELMTNDQMKIHHLKRYSKDDAIRNNMRGVCVLVKKEDEYYYRNEVFDPITYEHIRIIPVDKQWRESNGC